MFGTLVLSQFLSIFWGKNNISPRLSTLTYPREIFDQATTKCFLSDSNRSLVFIASGTHMGTSLRKRGKNFRRVKNRSQWLSLGLSKYKLPHLRSVPKTSIEDMELCNEK